MLSNLINKVRRVKAQVKEDIQTTPLIHKRRNLWSLQTRCSTPLKPIYGVVGITHKHGRGATTWNRFKLTRRKSMTAKATCPHCL